MTEVSFTNVVIVAVAAFAAPLALGLIPRLQLPAVVLEILLGIALGPSGLGWARSDLPVQVLALVGLAFLLFLAGLEVDLERLRGRPLRLAGLGFIVSLGLALSIGAGSVIRDVCTDRRVGAVVVAISDRDADGRDVSWIWDAEFERLVTLEAPLVAGGTRAADTAVRLKYGGRVPDVVDADPLAAVRAATISCPSDGLVAVLATYTAMLDIREALVGDRSTRAEDEVE